MAFRHCGVQINDTPPIATLWVHAKKNYVLSVGTLTYRAYNYAIIYVLVRYSNTNNNSLQIIKEKYFLAVSY